MRDAFGGTFMFEVFLIFMLIYIALTAISVNYAKAFKVKDKVVDYIESTEIADVSDMSAEELNEMEDFFNTEIVGKLNYMFDNSSVCSGKNYIYCKNGILIQEMGKGTNTEGVYYRVSTYFGWHLPFIDNFYKIGNRSTADVKPMIGVWEITGETRLIVKE